MSIQSTPVADNAVYDLIAAIKVIDAAQTAILDEPQAIYDKLYRAKQHLNNQLALELAFGGAQ